MSRTQVRPRGFTLVELLVVVAIIALLASLLSPSLQRARVMARRGVDAAHTGQLVHVFHEYAADYANRWPWANRETNAGPDIGRGHDDMVAFRYSTWLVLRDRYGVTEDLFACPVYHGTTWMDWFGQWSETYGGAVQGRMVWTGRSDTFYPETPYETPKSTIHNGTSDTAMTCLGFVRAPTWSEGLVPHVGMGDSIARTANGITDPYEFENEPEGLLVGYTHGAARWVPWHRLRAVRNHNWLFYDPKE